MWELKYVIWAVDLNTDMTKITTVEEEADGDMVQRSTFHETLKRFQF